MKEFVPQRRCIVCGTRGDKDSFVRIVKNKNDEIAVDIAGLLDGRGAYICKNSDCHSLLIKKGGLSRSFRMKIPAEIQTGLLEELINAEQ